MYKNLVKYFPDIDFFVDSSKDPFWIRDQNKLGQDSYLDHNVLVHKYPEELAISFKKEEKRMNGLEHILVVTENT